MPERAHLRIYGHGDVEVEFVTAYLADLGHAYNSIVVFDAAIDGYRTAHRELLYPFYFAPFTRSVTRRRDWRAGYWPPTADEVSSLVPHSEQLVVAGVSLHSPGYWEFFGKLNPLEVLRQYLNDRHERRKDREYRETAEARRLMLENLALENKVIAERIQLAKQLGATDRDLAPLLNALVYRPLAALDRHQDRGVIERAEVRRLSAEP